MRAEILADKNSGDGPGHTRVANGRLVWCYCCGAYAEHWSVGLSKPCTGRPRRWTSNAAGLSRLIKGMHPKSSVLLVDPPVLEIWCEQIVRHLSLAWRDTRVSGKRWGVETAPTAPPKNTTHGNSGTSSATKRIQSLLARVRAKVEANKRAVSATTDRRNVSQTEDVPVSLDSEMSDLDLKELVVRKRLGHKQNVTALEHSDVRSVRRRLTYKQTVTDESLFGAASSSCTSLCVAPCGDHKPCVVDSMESAKPRRLLSGNNAAGDDDREREAMSSNKRARR